MTAHSMTLKRASIVDANLVFETADGMRRALQEGCFLLAIPADLDLSPGVTLCREFYRPVSEGEATTVAYRGFRDREDIYFDREHFQTEHILLDGPARARHFPPAVIALCDRMNELALVVLRRTLAELGVAEPLWSRITGGAVDGRGTHWFAASHYRRERDQPGCPAHKDTGFVTVLYIEQEGLEAWLNGSWTSIDPVPGYFVVNFGGALEFLTKRLTSPVRAILHQVRQSAPSSNRQDRFSFASFANPPAAGDLFQLTAEGSALPMQTVEEFLREFNKKTWNDAYDDFGIVGPAHSSEQSPLRG